MEYKKLMLRRLDKILNEYLYFLTSDPEKTYTEITTDISSHVYEVMTDHCKQIMKQPKHLSRMNNTWKKSDPSRYKDVAENIKEMRKALKTLGLEESK